MGKIKINDAEAFERFQADDFDVFNYEMDRLTSQSIELEKEQKRQFFYVTNKDVILLEIYWDAELVYEATFG